MKIEETRRNILRAGAVGLGMLAVPIFPEWAFPALDQDEVVIPLTDYPDGWKTDRGPERRFYDIRKIKGPLTPANQFFTTQHYGHPKIDSSNFLLNISGLVKTPKEMSLEELRRLGSTELVAGFECSGNSARAMQGLVSNGRWSGVRLSTLLQAVGIKQSAREVVFFGADSGIEKVEFRGRTYEVEQQYGRSISIEQAMRAEPLLAMNLNNEPLSVHQGFPVRLLMPGWYGAPNVKWLSNIHLQRDPYLGKYQARWYRTLRSEIVGGKKVWKETAITRMRLKSVVARITRFKDVHKVQGFVLNDGTPLRSVEVRVDDDSWQEATVHPQDNKYSWKLFTYTWKSATPGEHTIISRVTDINGQVQPTREELTSKKTFLEDNSQHPRTVVIS